MNYNFVRDGRRENSNAWRRNYVETEKNIQVENKGKWK